MLEDFPELNKIFNNDAWNSKFGKIEDHPLIKIISEYPRRTKTSKENILHRLREIEDNLNTVLKKLDKRSKIKKLINGFQDPCSFYETEVEIIWISKWLSNNLKIDVEPLGKKNRGPDAKLSINDKQVFCEITSLGMSKVLEKKFEFEKAIKDNISHMEQKYQIHITAERELVDDDVTKISELIKNEIKNNKEESNFKCSYGDCISLSFSDNPTHYIEIHYVGSFNEECVTPRDNAEVRLLDKINEKIDQLNKAGDNIKVLIIDFGRYFDALGLYPMFIDGSLKNILGDSTPLGNYVLAFNSLQFQNLSALILIPYSTEKHSSPSCYINQKAKHVLSEDDVRTIACFTSKS
jgi:hypothetical protein